MKQIKIAILSSISVHASLYTGAFQTYPLYDWVAMSVTKEDYDRLHVGWIPEHIKIYETDEEMLKAHPDLDAVVLAGSNSQTYSEFLLCAKYGIKNILLMKMPTFFMDEYEEIQRIARENDMIVQIELQMRYSKVVRKLKQICDSGVIGKLLSVQINNTTVHVPSKFMPWVTEPALTYGKEVPLKDGEARCRGGAMTDHPHGFDLARYFTDSEFDTVYADVSPTIRPDLKVEDGVFILGKMKNGVVVNIDPSYSRHEHKLLPIHPDTVGWEGYPKRVEVDIILNGDKGSIIADCFHLGVFYIGLPYNNYAFYYSEDNSNSYPDIDELPSSVISDFAGSVINHKQPLVTLDLHKNTIKAMNACYESISLGKPVKLQ